MRGHQFGATCFRREPVAKDDVVAGLILGLPRNMDGSEGPRAQSTRAFANNMAGKPALPVPFWDERLSTAAVERAMISADVSRKKRAQQVDAAAATYILQGALDFIRFNAANRPMKKE